MPMQLFGNVDNFRRGRGVAVAAMDVSHMGGIAAELAARRRHADGGSDGTLMARRYVRCE